MKRPIEVTDLVYIFKPSYQNNFNCVIKETSIEITTMYGYVDINLRILIDLANLIGTDRFTVDSQSYIGCKICGYGPGYMKTFSWKSEDVGHFDAIGVEKK